jgi:uncharacterized protein YdeI (YjbR/CyaY-like superfamily)
MTAADAPLVEPGSRAEWRAWLAGHGDQKVGIWLVLRKGRETPLTYAEAVEEAVAAGWIDSKANKLDDRRYKLWMAPRKPGSMWASSNKERVARLTEQGLMTPRGQAIVDAAKADGSWAAFDAALELQVPDDLREALGVDAAAAAFFAGLRASRQRVILAWIQEAKTAETRAKRIRRTAEAAANGLRPDQWPRLDPE